jgi:ABC-type transport system involved in cytochrome bd biosynthesis fused ATPase/permease subunit
LVSYGARLVSYGARFGVMRNISKSRFKMLNEVTASTRTRKRQLIGRVVSAGERRELVSCS